MKIAVLIKQVPNTTKVRLDPVTNNLIRDGVESIMNPYDVYALEFALQIKKMVMCDGGKVSFCVYSMGPQAAGEIMKYAFAVGADRGVLLSDRAFAGSDTLATSYILSEALKKDGMPDLIICGKQAIDGDTAQVPVEVAGHLKMPCLTNVYELVKVSEDERRITVGRKTDYADMTMSAGFPAVITVDKGYFDTTLPTVGDMIRAKYMDIELWTAETLGADAARMSVQGSPTQVVKVFAPEMKKESRMLSGTLEEQMEECLKLLAEKGIDLKS